MKRFDGLMAARAALMTVITVPLVSGCVVIGVATTAVGVAVDAAGVAVDVAVGTAKVAGKAAGAVVDAAAADTPTPDKKSTKDRPADTDSGRDQVPETEPAADGGKRPFPGGPRR